MARLDSGHHANQDDWLSETKDREGKEKKTQSVYDEVGNKKQNKIREKNQYAQ